MSKNFWQKERSSLFKNLLRQYKEEGYDNKEAKQLAKIEINEVMEDKEDFVSNIWKETFEDD
jgi:hypothetical protein|tara:strand:- start:3218 stop:3403 length:186 start_codon:yes stop_codon:yes gene_type:complete